MQKPIGWVIVGSPAKSVTLNPSGTCIVRAASSGTNGFSTTGCTRFFAACAEAQNKRKMKHLINMPGV